MRKTDYSRMKDVLLIAAAAGAISLATMRSDNRYRCAIPVNETICSNEKTFSTKNSQRLVDKLSDAAPGVRKAAIAELGRRMERSAITPLSRLLKDEDIEVQDASAQALAGMGKDALPQLKDGLKDDDPKMRIGCARALARMKDEKGAVEALVNSLGDKNPDVNDAVSSALATIGEPAIGPLICIISYKAEMGARDGGALDGGIALPEKKKERVREDALFALFDMGGTAIPALIEYIGDKNNDSGQRTMVIEWLGERGDGKAAPMLIQIIEDKNEDDFIRQYSIESLGRLDTPLGTGTLKNALEEGGAISDAAALAFGDRGDPSAVPAIVKRIRTIAYEDGAQSDSATSFECFMNNNDRLDTRVSFIIALTRMGKEAVPALADSLQKEKDPQARMGIVFALRRIGGESARMTLENSLLHDPSPHVRKSAAWALYAIKDKRSIPALRKISTDPVAGEWARIAIKEIEKGESDEED